MGGRGSKDYLPHGRLAFGLFSLLTSLLPFLGVIFIFFNKQFLFYAAHLKRPDFALLGSTRIFSYPVYIFFLNSNKIVTEFPSELVSKFFY